MGYFVIGADFVPTESNSKQFIDADTSTLFGKELEEIIMHAEYRIFNMEYPLTASNNSIPKCGASLKSNPKAINLYKQCNVNLFTIANNHIMDYGSEGLIETINSLTQNKINYLGAGKNLNEASKPYVFMLSNGKTFGIYACTEHEFSICDIDYCGANPFDFLETFDQITSLKEKCDVVIVLYHGGIEFYRYPSPDLQKVCRKMIDSGADIVITQHSHCVGCAEKWKNGKIIYGQGNFLFDRGKTEFWNTGLLLKINIENLDIEYIPLKRTGNSIRIAKGQDKYNIMNGFHTRSVQILDQEELKREYKKFANESATKYLLTMNGILEESFVYKVINKLLNHKLGNIIRFFIKSCKKKQLLAAVDYINCESHRELMLEGIKIITGIH